MRTAGTVYADPYPGFVHGEHPAICKNGCEPVPSTKLGETQEQKLWREAAEFVDQYSYELGLPDEVSASPAMFLIQLVCYVSQCRRPCQELAFAESQDQHADAWFDRRSSELRVIYVGEGGAQEGHLRLTGAQRHVRAHV